MKKGFNKIIQEKEKEGGNEMVSLKGTGVFQDIVVGRLVFYEREPFQIQKEAVQDAGEEMLRYLRAKEQALLQVQALHELAPGAQLEVLTGLGRGFDLARSGGAPLLLGGGSGTAPMLYLARELSKLGTRPAAALGFGTAAECCFEREFRELCSDLRVFTQDGSRGERGLVTQALERGGYSFVYACGPLPMLRAVDEKSAAPGQFSLEARMGCGFGACMGCTVETKNGPGRVCRDGPVFGLGEVRW